ncbi:MAG: LysR family transcriptional regulator [Rhodocyclaceae bacterium]|nr:LysR family transcriptional regulator [Rhodocyclaceae bacterium]
MIASTHDPLTPADLETVLALCRAGQLASAAERLGVAPSTVFRAVQRIERRLAQPLFLRSRSGYRPLELATRLAADAERIEAALEHARAEARQAPDEITGSVRITTTDTLLHGLLAPALPELRRRHPRLDFELTTGHALANLSRREADVALRATRKPPDHLVGRPLGPIHVCVYAARTSGLADLESALERQADWIAPDDALPDHPTVEWRRKHLPRVVPAYRVDSLLTLMDLVGRGLGVGLGPAFLAERRTDLVALTPPLAECETALWLLTHPESRHLRRVAAVSSHLASAIRLSR